MVFSSMSAINKIAKWGSKVIAYGDSCSLLELGVVEFKDVVF